MDRRDVLKASAALTVLPIVGCVAQPIRVHALRVGDPGTRRRRPRQRRPLATQRHTGRVHVKPGTLDELRRAIVEAKAAGRSVSVAGGRHAISRFAMLDQLFQKVFGGVAGAKIGEALGLGLVDRSSTVRRPSPSLFMVIGGIAESARILRGQSPDGRECHRCDTFVHRQLHRTLTPS